MDCRKFAPGSVGNPAGYVVHEPTNGNLLANVSYPIVAVLMVLSYLRVIWADLGCGIAVGILGPLAIFRALA